MKRVTPSNFQSDRLYPRVAKAVSDLLGEGLPVSVPAVFVGMGMLSEAHLRDWRESRVPYLKRVIMGNLGKTSRVVRLISLHAHKLGLVPAAPHSAGNIRFKGRPLRFSKTGEGAVEEAYRRVFVARRRNDLEESAPGAPSNDELQRTSPAQATENRR